MIQYLPFIYAGAGALSRVFVPWLITRIKHPDSEESSWNWRYIWPQLATFAVVVLIAPLTGNVDAIANMGFVAAYTAGWGLCDIGQTIILDGAIEISRSRR